MIARVLAEKDTLRSQLMELQEQIFSLQTRGGGEQQQQRVSNTLHLQLLLLLLLQARRRSRADLLPPQESEEDWGSLRSSDEERLCSRRRLCRMDAINPLTASLCMAEVSVRPSVRL